MKYRYEKYIQLKFKTRINKILKTQKELLRFYAFQYYRKYNQRSKYYSKIMIFVQKKAGFLTVYTLFINL